MSAQTLPSELLLEVFGLLDRESLKECTRVCNAWRFPALQLYFENITLKAFEVHCVKSLLAKKEQDRNQYFGHCNLTKKLTIKHDNLTLDYVIRIKEEAEAMDKDNGNDSEYSPKDTLLDKEEFLLLLSYMPNLRIINVRESSNFAFYMTYLQELDTSKYLFDIEEIITKYISTIGLLTGDEEVNSYFATFYKFRETLTHLALHYRKTTHTFGDTIDDELGYLSHFKNLTHLDFYDEADGNITLFDLQRICPGLKQLKFGSREPVPNRKTENVVTLMDKNINMGVSPASLSYLNRNLQVLDLSFLSLPVSYVNYITKYIPNSLDTLHIRLNEANLYDWINEIGLKAVLKFAHRLSLMKNASIEFHGVKDMKNYQLESQKLLHFLDYLGF